RTQHLLLAFFLPLHGHKEEKIKDNANENIGGEERDGARRALLLLQKKRKEHVRLFYTGVRLCGFGARPKPVPHLSEIRHKLPQNDSLPDLGHDVKVTLQIVPGREGSEK